MSELSDDLEVVVYDKTRHRTGWVAAAKTISMTPRHNQQPSGSITLAGDDRKIRLLRDPGARVVCWYRGEYLLGGMVRQINGEGDTSRRELTFQVQDDWRLLRRILAWQVPGSAATAQSSAEYKTYTGPAETVAKTILSENITRLGLPVTVAPSLGRGATITVKVRMTAPSDALFPALDQAGIGLTVRQADGHGPTGGNLVVDAYAPTDYPIVLSEEGGTLSETSWSLTPPEVTRVILALEGEGTARQFRGPYVNAAAEALYGDVIEQLVDARDLKTTDPNFAALATQRANEALAEGAAVAGLSLELNESQTLRYGGENGVHVGDRLTAAIVGAGVPTITDVLRQATITLGGDGLQVTPSVGEREDDPSAGTMEAVRALAQRVRAFSWRR